MHSRLYMGESLTIKAIETGEFKFPEKQERLRVMCRIKHAFDPTFSEAIHEKTDGRQNETRP